MTLATGTRLGPYEIVTPVGAGGMRNLDGDGAIEARVARTIHLAHAPCAERCGDLVRSQPGSWSQGHRGVR